MKKSDTVIDLSDFFEGGTTELEFDMGDFDLVDMDEQENRYLKPKFSGKPIKVDYANAKDLALKIKCNIGEQVHALVHGDFIFGDFIEALLVEKNLVCQKMHLSTLSMSQNNIDSLAGLLETKRIENLDLILSNYFYSHEKNRLIKYLLTKCDKGNLDLKIIRNHTKICLMEISNLRIVITGSSNLRSSQSIEQFCLQESAELFDFYKELFTKNQDYSIIDREVKA